MLCKEVTGEALQCPARSTKAPIGNGYKSLARHLIGFRDHQRTLPLKFNQTKLKRLERKSVEEEKVVIEEEEVGIEEEKEGIQEGRL